MEPINKPKKELSKVLENIQYTFAGDVISSNPESFGTPSDEQNINVM